MFTAILPTLNYAQPMNTLHPLNGRGLRVWWKSLPNISGAGIIPDLAGNRYSATPAKHTWAGAGPFGPRTLCPVYNSTSQTVTLTTFTSNLPLRTFTCWFNRTGAGGLNDGYLLSKRDSGHTEIDSFDVTDTDSHINYNQRWSTAFGNWWIAGPPKNEWHFVGVSYDSGSTANDPTMYLDGVSKTVTRGVAPTGTVSTNTDPYRIGNQGNPTTGFDGPIDDFRIYDRILNAGEHYQLFVDSKAPYSPLYNWQENQAVIFATSKPFLLWRKLYRLMRG